MAFRKKIFHSIEELQADLDQWVWQYNHERTHTGKYCFGRTPYQTFQDTKRLAQEKMPIRFFLLQEVNFSQIGQLVILVSDKPGVSDEVSTITHQSWY